MSQYDARLDPSSDSYSPSFVASESRRLKYQGGLTLPSVTELTPEADPDLSGGIDPLENGDGAFDAQKAAQEYRSRHRR